MLVLSNRGGVYVYQSWSDKNPDGENTYEVVFKILRWLFLPHRLFGVSGLVFSKKKKRAFGGIDGKKKNVLFFTITARGLALIALFELLQQLPLLL